jgi:hypothetical protein
VAKNKAAHHAISAPFSTSIDFKNQPLVIQYEVKYQKGGNCGGGYVKLLEDGFQTSGKEFSDHTPWVVMFGPDLTCPGTKACTCQQPFKLYVVLNFLHVLGSFYLPSQEPSYRRGRGETSQSIAQAFY